MFTFCKVRWARQKKWKENHATKVTKIPKTKRRKYEMKKEKSRTIRHFPLQIRFALSILPSVGKASKQTATRGAVMLSKAWEGQ